MRKLTALLRRAPFVDEVTVLDSPDSHLGRLAQPERLDDLLHEVKVGGENELGDGGLVLGADDAREAENEEVGEEGQLVAGSVIEALWRSERRAELEAKLGEGGRERRVDEVGVDEVGSLFCAVEPALEAKVRLSLDPAAVLLGCEGRRELFEQVENESGVLRSKQRESASVLREVGWERERRTWLCECGASCELAALNLAMNASTLA